MLQRLPAEDEITRARGRWAVGEVDHRKVAHAGLAVPPRVSLYLCAYGVDTNVAHAERLERGKEGFDPRDVAAWRIDDALDAMLERDDEQRRAHVKRRLEARAGARQRVVVLASTRSRHPAI